MYTDLALFIDGLWRGATEGATEEVVNPASGKAFATLPHATAEDLEAAIGSSQKGFSVWRNTNAHARAKILHAAGGLVRQRADHIARVMVQEQGKTLAEAKAEVLYAADVIDWYAEEGTRAYGRVVPSRRKGTRQL